MNEQTRQNPVERLIATSPTFAPLILRLGLAIVILPHGLQKVFGLFGGAGISGTIQSMATRQGLPAAIAVLVIATEFLAPIALAAGFFTRIGALALGIEMTVAAFLVHAPRGFFMNWQSKQAGEGFEFHILAVAIAAASVLLGGGRFSFDRWLCARRQKR